MTTILLETSMRASIEKTFDMARSLDVHLQSAAHTKEKIVAGRTGGLCELNDEITWEARHFGIRQRLSSKITGMEKPRFFEDTMLKGAFKSMRHEHHFEEINGITTMKDVFMYAVPYGFLGKLFNWLVLKRYMTRFIRNRNQVIKAMAENSRFKV